MDQPRHPPGTPLGGQFLARLSPPAAEVDLRELLSDDEHNADGTYWFPPAPRSARQAIAFWMTVALTIVGADRVADSGGDYIPGRLGGCVLASVLITDRSGRDEITGPDQTPGDKGSQQPGRSATDQARQIRAGLDALVCPHNEPSAPRPAGYHCQPGHGKQAEGKPSRSDG